MLKGKKKAKQRGKSSPPVKEIIIHQHDTANLEATREAVKSWIREAKEKRVKGTVKKDKEAMGGAQNCGESVSLVKISSGDEGGWIKAKGKSKGAKVKVLMYEPKPPDIVRGSQKLKQIEDVSPVEFEKEVISRNKFS